MIEIIPGSPLTFDKLPVGALFLTGSNEDFLYLKISEFDCVAISEFRTPSTPVNVNIHKFGGKHGTSREVKQVQICSLKEVV
jgi:hypothetical protein